MELILKEFLHFVATVHGISLYVVQSDINTSEGDHQADKKIKTDLSDRWQKL